MGEEKMNYEGGWLKGTEGTRCDAVWYGVPMKRV